MESQMKVGFIGLGAMGLPMTRNILKAGFALCAYDIRPEPLQAIQSLGATVAHTSGQVAAQSDVVITMLPDSNSVEEAILGKQGVVEGANPGLVLVEMSTTSIGTIQKINQILSKKDCFVLDAPVSGIPQSAETAQLSIMVGGDEQVMARCLPLLQSIGNKVIFTGPVGSARLAKFVNNMLVTMNMLSAMEILAWAHKMGAQDDKLIEVIKNSMSYSRVFEYHVDSLASRKADYLSQHIWLHKDLKLLLEEAESAGSALPLAAQAKQLLHSARNVSGGEETIGALLAYFNVVTGAINIPEKE